MTKIPYIALCLVILVLGSIGTMTLAWFALSSPGPASTRALISVKSSDGTAVWLGLFRSCVLIAQGRLTCSPFAFNPKYNFSVLGEGAPVEVIDTPAPFLRGLVWVVSVNTVVVLPLIIWFILRQEIKALQPPKPWDIGILLILFTIEMFTSIVGALTFWFLNLLYEKTAQHFNVFTTLLGRPDLTAYTGTSFQMAYGGYILVAFAWTVIATECYYISLESDTKPPDVNLSFPDPSASAPAPAPAPTPVSSIPSFNTYLAQWFSNVASTLTGSSHPAETPVSPPKVD